MATEVITALRIDGVDSDIAAEAQSAMKAAIVAAESQKALHAEIMASARDLCGVIAEYGAAELECVAAIAEARRGAEGWDAAKVIQSRKRAAEEMKRQRIREIVAAAVPLRDRLAEESEVASTASAAYDTVADHLAGVSSGTPTGTGGADVRP